MHYNAEKIDMFYRYINLLNSTTESLEYLVQSYSSIDTTAWMAKAFSRTLFHSDLRLAIILQLVTLETLKSSSTQSAHLNSGLPPQ
ncbi:UNVERIFIED_CONTAM: hypothetical protein NCL1_04687 [Trichonephila clavipes]